MIHSHKQKGFTLIELMVSIVIIAVISSIGLVTYSNAQKVARDGQRKDNLRSLQTPLELYNQRNNVFPATLDLLVPDYINSLPTDPTTNANYEYHQLSGGYVLCTDLENNSDPDRPATMDPNCSGSDDFFVRYP